MEATTNQKVSQAQIRVGLDVILAIGDAIRELGEVPNGHLYARVMSKLSLGEYEKVIGILKGAGLIKESANLLTWIGPAKVGA
jgi:hypothetical protein